MSEPSGQFALLSAALADRYRLEKPLGEGGMATVYVAQDLRHDRQVALKVLKPELAEALGAQRFLKEIQVTANLQHPHILPLYDSGNANGALFYVMPLVRGESLRERLTRDKQLTVDDTVRIIRQIAGALDFAHRQGILHRDIKPENILVQDGEALLADFGIALALSGTAESRMTGTGLSIGMALSFTGRFDEAVAEGKRAAELDPWSPQILIDAAMSPLFRKDTAGSRALAAKAADLDPTFFFPVMIEGWIQFENGRFREAVPYMRKAIAMGAPPFVTAYLAYALGAAGDRAAAMREVESLRRMSPDGKILPFNMAIIYLGIGDHVRALDNLEKAYDADSQLLAWLGQDAMFDPLRSEPRFIALMRKLNFVR